MRQLVLLAALFSYLNAASGQDMPLRDWTRDGETWQKSEGKKPTQSEIRTTVDIPGMKPTATVSTPQSDTLYVGFADQNYLWAFPLREGQPQTGQPYAQLRCPIVSTQLVTVTSLTMDPAGRIYAATPLGVQVFDPTGRLSGVLLSPAKGEMSHLQWENDSLSVWVGEQKYTRKMK